MMKTVKALACAAALAATTLGGSAQAEAWQCAPFARLFSGIQLFGAAATWWGEAIGRYAEGTLPKVGSVLVFKAINSMRSGHVATVTQVISDRIVKVTHANWSVINGHRGQVEHDVTVVDASPNNDWSQVKVWYAPIADVGQKAYPTYGFIYADAASAVAKVGAAN